jgi:hypothetical protein
VRAGSSNPDTVTMHVDIRNACNCLLRQTLLDRVFDQVPALGPLTGYPYGTPSKLYVDGAPADSTPLLSRDGLCQGAPTGPLLFALAIQPELEQAASAHSDCSLVAYADDITLQGSQSGVASTFRALRDALLPHRLRVNLLKCKVYCADAAVASETAVNRGCTAA